MNVVVGRKTTLTGGSGRGISNVHTYRQIIVLAENSTSSIFAAYCS